MRINNINTFREYMDLRMDFIESSLDFLRENDYCFVIEAENGVIGFNSQGKEIYREIPYKNYYEWKEKIVTMCLTSLGMSSEVEN